MKALSQIVFTLLVKAMAVAVGVSCALILLIYFKQGDSSPGILVVAKSALGYWISLVFTLIALWFVVTCARVLLLARRRASAAGLSLTQYFDLTPEKRLKLQENHQNVK